MPSEYTSQLKALHSLGADIIGVNCRFGPMSLQTIGFMKDALDKERTRHLMMQPGFGYHTPKAGILGTDGLLEPLLGDRRVSIRELFASRMLSRYPWAIP